MPCDLGKGDLGDADLAVDRDDTGTTVYSIRFERKGRFSDADEHEFRPDVTMRVGNYTVPCFLMYHYDNADHGKVAYVDVHIVLRSADKADNRIMRWTGYLENAVEGAASLGRLYKDSLWKYVRFRCDQ